MIESAWRLQPLHLGREGVTLPFANRAFINKVDLGVGTGRLSVYLTSSTLAILVGEYDNKSNRGLKASNQRLMSKTEKESTGMSKGLKLLIGAGGIYVSFLSYGKLRADLQYKSDDVRSSHSRSSCRRLVRQLQVPAHLSLLTLVLTLFSPYSYKHLI